MKKLGIEKNNFDEENNESDFIDLMKKTEENFYIGKTNSAADEQHQSLDENYQDYQNFN